MDANDCSEFENRCIELVNEAGTPIAKSKLLYLAQSWSRVVDEIDDDPMLRNQVSDVAVFKSANSHRQMPFHSPDPAQRTSFSAARDRD